MTGKNQRDGWDKRVFPFRMASLPRYLISACFA